MDITIKFPNINIAQEEEKIYLEGYLSILKNEIPVITSEGETRYYEDLWKAGIEFDELLKEAIPFSLLINLQKFLLK